MSIQYIIYNAHYVFIAQVVIKNKKHTSKPTILKSILYIEYIFAYNNNKYNAQNYFTILYKHITTSKATERYS